MIFKNIFLTLSPKKLFLLDSAGALISALLLGLVLPTFESIFRVPNNILYLLSSIAIGLSIYSFICYWYFKPSWKAFMKGLAAANLMYLFLTATLLLYNYTQVTQFAITYFILETVLIFILVSIEIRMIYKKTFVALLPILLLVSACHKKSESNFHTVITNNTAKVSDIETDWMNFKYDKVIVFATIDPFYHIPTGKSIDISHLKDTISITLSKSQIVALDSVINGQKNSSTGDSSMADCFNPRHNILFLKQDSVVNYISVCYECGYYRTSKSGISGNMQAFKNFFDNLGLKVFDEPTQHSAYYDSLINKRKQ